MYMTRPCFLFILTAIIHPSLLLVCPALTPLPFLPSYYGHITFQTISPRKIPRSKRSKFVLLPLLLKRPKENPDGEKKREVGHQSRFLPKKNAC
ncbi:hypothetical protein B0J18DRAFT_435727 [Chaetomium sp. MPI-SDFR-AT-0129]|nr:hypothetical protein B0J18DRAFT_435727 [Chaetomium sp. MPI-SDFR-AT-0129]